MAVSKILKNWRTVLLVCCAAFFAYWGITDAMTGWRLANSRGMGHVAIGLLYFGIGIVCIVVAWRRRVAG